MQALSAPDRAREASQRRRHCDRPGVDRLHVGHCSRGARAARSHARGGGETRATDTGVALDDVKRRLGRPSCLDRGRRQTDLSTVVPNPRISAGSIVGSTGPVPPLPLASPSSGSAASTRQPRAPEPNRASRENCVLLDSRSHINVRLVRRRLMVAPAAVGCKPCWAARSSRVSTA